MKKLDLAELADALPREGAEADDRWRPLLVGLNPEDGERFAALCQAHQITPIDTIRRQLDDLALIRMPSLGATAQREQFVRDAVDAAGGPIAYGTWVCLPWERKAVHLLDRDEYYEVITNRNRNKITLDEQRLLRNKTIGAVGLSVGGEAAVTVAQEHLCGKMVLADFDRLDLSNLNRLNAGCDELGHRKTTIVARRIVKIDPYLELTVYDDGVTEGNIDSFLTGLDLLIEECDGLRIKYALRECARRRGLNIVYAADERGFLSVEPYGEHPELSLFHGRVATPQPARESYESPLAFMKALSVWLGGWDNLSEQSRVSLEQIGDSLCGYPQLASEARFAAGQIGHVARRLLLGHRVAPFLGNLDLDRLV